MSLYRKVLPLAILAVIGTASADEAAKPAKPAVPAFADLLDAWGVKFTGYVDATFTMQHEDKGVLNDKQDYNGFQLQQAAFTLSKLPASGAGALVNVVAGENPYNATGEDATLLLAPGTLEKSNAAFYLLQGYVQYASGAWTIAAGKFATLAGAEVAAPNGNTNTTRSLLFAFEPVTHSGVRLTYTVSDALSFNFGVNNGWTGSQEFGDTTSKTGEVGLAYAPSKTFSWVFDAYYGRTPGHYGALNPIGSVSIGDTDILLADTVLTINATSALSVVASVDYGSVSKTTASPSASWYGVAAYVNYAWTSQFRSSLRAEYFDDSDGYWYIPGFDQKLKEYTLTFGYAPVDSFEFRVEGRYDDPDKLSKVQVVPKNYQAWLEAIYKF
jgi:hypothetical protein